MFFNKLPETFTCFNLEKISLLIVLLHIFLKQRNLRPFTAP